jgi:tRNA dimethylallyltransferase
MGSDSPALRCLAVTGPTACGKTDLAIALAREFPIEIVSMDSALVYRGMDIGTAKPDRGIRNEVPHHLIDILEPEQSYSAGQFVADSTRLIAEIASRSRIPLIVGGTMLYLKALRDGIAPLPERDADVRKGIDARASQIGWPALHTELANFDPAAATRIKPTDRQRIQRALEVYAITGKTMTEIQRETAAGGVAVTQVALIPGDRAKLAKTIEHRFGQMVQNGLVDEVRRLRDRPGLDARSASMRAVGYRQVRAFLDGHLEWDEAANRAVTATRQLAKRQMTWLRGDAEAEKLKAEDTDLLEKLRRRVGRYIDNA